MNRAPRLPLPCAWIGSRLPAGLPNRVLGSLLNSTFEAARRDGELDWLRDKVIDLVFEDSGIRLRICTDADGLLLVRSGGPPADVTIEGLVYDFLLLATRREDPDTLFFQRRLRLSGNVEVGLHLKNFLDSFEPNVRPQRAAAIVNAILDLVEGLRQRNASAPS